MLLLLSMQLPGHAAPPEHAALLRMLLSHCHAAKARKYKFKCSIHGQLILQIGIYIMGDFSKSGSQFKSLHTIQKFFLDIYQYMFYKYFFHFFTSYFFIFRSISAVSG
jgi:hypothetical protein